jgi:hypothetical protein
MSSLGAFNINPGRMDLIPEPSRPVVKHKTPDYNTPKFNTVPRVYIKLLT